MTTLQDIISDEEIERVHAYANFGKVPKRVVVADALFQCAGGYTPGSTAMAIISEHGLLHLSTIGKRTKVLSKKGHKYLYEAFKHTTYDAEHAARNL